MSLVVVVCGWFWLLAVVVGLWLLVVVVVVVVVIFLLMPAAVAVAMVMNHVCITKRGKRWTWTHHLIIQVAARSREASLLQITDPDGCLANSFLLQ